METVRWLLRCAVLFALLGCSGRPAFAAEGPRLALVVGMGAYQHLPQLGNAVGDARLIADKLRATGFSVDLETDLTRDQLDRAVRDFAHKIETAGPNAVATLYYAGHGVQDDQQNNYLVAIDADVRSQVDLPLEAMPLDRALQTLEAAHPSLSFVVLDACRDDPLPVSASRGARRGLAVEAQRSGLLIAFSTEPGKTAEDGPAGGHSPFAAALAEELDAPGLEATQLFRLVTKKVLDTTHKGQFPWISERLVDEFYFRPAPPDTGGQVAVAPALQAALPPPSANRPAGPEAAEIAYGEAVLANTTEAYENWLRKYPDSDRKASIIALLQRLREEELWRRANDAPTPAEAIRAIETQLLAFSTGIYADKARAKLAALQAADKPPEVEAIHAPSPQGPAPVARRLPGTDAYGNDRGGFLTGVATVDACEDLCGTDSGCVGYTYNTGRQVCILKNSIGSLVTAREPAITGIFDTRIHVPASPEPAGTSRILYYEDTDAPSNDLMGLLPGIDVGSCERLCVSRPDCAGYTYNRKRSVCIPKGRIDSLQRSREPAVTGVLQSRSGAGQPVPRPSPSLSPQQICSDFVTNYYSQWSSENQNAMSYIERSYAAIVLFYGKNIRREDLIAKKLEFATRWPRRAFSLTSLAPPTVQGDQCTVGGVVAWRTERDAQPNASRGSALFSLTLKLSETPQIVAESGRVLEKSN